MCADCVYHKTLSETMASLGTMDHEKQRETKGKHAMADEKQTQEQEAEMLRDAMNEFNHIVTIDRTDKVVAAFSLTCKANRI